MPPKYDVVRSTFATWGVSCCPGRPPSATIVSVPAPGFRAESANVLSSFAFLLAALMAFRRWWRQTGGDDIASLRLIIAVAAVGLRSFAFHALATLGAAVLDVGPIAVVICSAPFVALHRFLVAFARRRLLARLRGAVTQRLVPTGILNGSIGYVARSVRSAWWRPWRGERAIAFAPNATAATGFRRGSRACTENWLVAAHDIGVFVTSLALRSIDFICGTIPVGTRFFWHLLKTWCHIASIY
jgi:hypothetical protein